MTTSACMDTTTSKLLAAVDRINDEYVLEAERMVRAKSTGWIKWVAAAACVAVVLMGAIPFFMKVSPAHLTAPEERVYESYEEFSAVVNDSVFDELIASDVTHDWFVEFSTVWIDNDEGQMLLQDACILLNHLDSSGGQSDEVSSVSVIKHIGSLNALTDDVEFEMAEQFGVRNDYSVCGVIVQKFFYLDELVSSAEEQVSKNPDNPVYLEDLEKAKADDSYAVYWERVSIDGEWYYVKSCDESAADSIAGALAYIASSHSQ